MKKRILSMLLVLAMCFTLLPAGTVVMAAETITIYVYSPYGDSAQVTLSPEATVAALKETVATEFGVTFGEGSEYRLYGPELRYPNSLLSNDTETLTQVGLMNGSEVWLESSGTWDASEQSITLFGLTISGGVGCQETFGDYANVDFVWNYYYKYVVIRTETPLTISGTGEQDANIVANTSTGYSNLTISDLTLTESSGACIVINGGRKLKLTVEGENSFTTTGGYSPAISLNSENSILIITEDSTGKLAAESRVAGQPGIGAGTRNQLPVLGIEIHGGEIITSGGAGAAGIRTDVLKISGGTVVANSGTGNTYGIEILETGDDPSTTLFEITGGEVTASSESGQALNMAPVLANYAGHKATASVNADGADAETYDSTKNDTYKYFHIASVVDSSVAAVLHEGEYTYYETLYRAVEAAQDGDTVLLMKDVELPNDYPATEPTDTTADDYAARLADYQAKVAGLDPDGKTGPVIINKDITLTSMDPNDPCTITGFIGIASGDHHERSFLRIQADVMLTDIILDGTKAKGQHRSPLVTVESTGTLTLDDGAVLQNLMDARGLTDPSLGGGVAVLGGTLIMEDGSLISNCSAAHGGGVYLDGGAVFTMNGGMIEKGSAEFGAGVAVNNATFTMNGGIITENVMWDSGIDWGGGIYMGHENAVFIMNGGEISKNDCKSGSGGGVNVKFGTFTIYDGKIIDNKSSNGGGGIAINDVKSRYIFINNGWVQYEDDGVSNATVNIHGGEISGNSVVDSSGNLTGVGGGIRAANNVSVTIHGGEIKNNKAKNGGGVFISSDNTTLNVDGGELSGNTAVDGGGIYVQSGVVNITKGAISENTVSQYGGGVYVNLGRVNVSGSQINGNTASKNGGGIYSAYGAVIMDNGTISGNTAENVGGAIFINPSAGLRLTGGSITENTAKNFGGGIEIAPKSVVRIYGAPVVKGNTSPEETDGGLYFDYDSRGKLTPAEISIGELSANADLHWFTWMQAHLTDLTDNRLLLAAPDEGREAITDYDLSRMSYNDDNYDLILDGGNMYLVQRIPATGITLAADSLSLKVGETGTLTATLTPDNTTVPITWTSSDIEIATIDNGVVTALKPGTVIITASVPGGYSDTCTVTVVTDCTITYDLAGGTGVSGVDYSAETVVSGTELTVKAAPTRDGYTFTGWSDGTTTHQPNDKITVNSNITLIAQWQEVKPPVDPNPPSGSSTGTAQLIKIDADDSSKVLPGVVFELYRSNDSLIGTYTTDKNGEIKVADLQAGSYYWKEIKTVEGYVLKETKYSFTVSASQMTTTTAENEKDRVPDAFTNDHHAYIIGYDDGLVHPEDNITRAEVATVFFRLLNEETRNQYMTRSNRFSDVSENAWYNTAVSIMAAMGVVKGRPDGTFDPDASITRAELAAIAARFDANGNTSGAYFTDIDGHWAMKEINIAANNGWVIGYEDGTFRPDQNITRAEAMTLVNRVLQRIPESVNDLEPEMIVWPDNMDTAKWYYLMVQEATNSHYYVQKPNGFESWNGLRKVPDWSALER